ncbi:MAG: hypothetical protein RMJ97_02145 [Raineya sp.]|nr:hypothetical protein [Raineya sp.]
MKNLLQQLRILHLALTTMVVIIGGVFHFVLLPFVQNKPTENNIIFQITTVVIVVGSQVFIKSVLPKFLTNAQNQPNLETKLQTYKIPFMMKLAILEGACLMALVFYLFTAKFFYVGMATAVLILLILQYPTPQNLAYDLKLSQEEQQELQTN